MNTNFEFTQRIKDLEDTVQSLSTAPQSYQADWINLNPTEYIYNSATRIDISDFDPRSRFSIGDRLELTQSSTTKYFYVIDVQSDHIKIYAGTDYTFTSDTITSIRASKNIKPTGFPDFFNYDATVDVNVGSITKDVLSTEQFYMIGGVYYVFSQYDLSSISAGNSIIIIYLPTQNIFANSYPLSEGNVVHIYDQVAFTDETGFTTSLSNGNFVGIRKMDGSNYSTTNSIDLVYTYITE